MVAYFSDPVFGSLGAADRQEDLSGYDAGPWIHVISVLLCLLTSAGPRTSCFDKMDVGRSWLPFFPQENGVLGHGSSTSGNAQMRSGLCYYWVFLRSCHRTSNSEWLPVCLITGIFTVDFEKKQYKAIKCFIKLIYSSLFTLQFMKNE